jgi:hypothetical protein
MDGSKCHNWYQTNLKAHLKCSFKYLFQGVYMAHRAHAKFQEFSFV